MDSRLIEQLAELAESFNRIGLKPVICGDWVSTYASTKLRDKRGK